MMKKQVKLIVSNGQYETAATTITVNYTTERGLLRRVTQLEHEHAVFGDNWAGWISANVAVANDADEWGDNSIIGGQWCNPKNGYLQEDEVDGPYQCNWKDFFIQAEAAAVVVK